MAIQIKRFEVSENCKDIDTEAMLAEVAKIREYALNGIESDSDLMGSIQAIVAFQLPDGSFPVTVGTPLPSDASVDLVFRPTYACCQALVHALSLGIKLDDMRVPLSRGLAACCRRNLEGHGYEALERQAEDLADFGHCGLWPLRTCQAPRRGARPVPGFHAPCWKDRPELQALPRDRPRRRCMGQGPHVQGLGGSRCPWLRGQQCTRGPLGGCRLM